MTLLYTMYLIAILTSYTQMDTKLVREFMKTKITVTSEQSKLMLAETSHQTFIVCR